MSGKIRVPADGTPITVQDGELVVPNEPIICFIEGDGVGADIMTASRRVWDAAVRKSYGGSRRIAWMEVYAGEKAAERYDGVYVPAETLEALRNYVVGIRGPLVSTVDAQERSPSIVLRQALDLYIYVRPIRWYRGVPSPLKHPEAINLVVFRENTEDVYAGIEYAAGTPENERLARFLRDELGAQFSEGAGLGIKPISAFGSKRLVRAAIRYTLKHGRRSLTLAHKGNVQRHTEGAFRQWGYEVAAEEFAGRTITLAEAELKHDGRVPEGRILVQDMIADVLFQRALTHPEQLDVIAAPNLTGDFLTDVITAEVGGVSVVPGANLGDGVALFETTHGTSPRYADQDRVNPSSLLLAGVMLLEHIGWQEAADLIVRAYQTTLDEKIATYDIARQMQGAMEVRTSEFATAIIRNLG